MPTPPTTLRQVVDFFRPRIARNPVIPQIKINTVYGDPMAIPSESATTRLYFLNLNGINLEKQSVKFRDLCEEIKRSDIDIFAAAEHNLDSNKFAVRQALQTIARKSKPINFTNLGAPFYWRRVTQWGG
jgi:hypothetical protein